jgi:Co/Zn/Cd efflux system component
VKADTIFLFLALVAILYSKTEHAKGVHNYGWYLSLLYSLVEFLLAICLVKAGQVFFLFLALTAILCSEAKCASNVHK